MHVRWLNVNCDQILNTLIALDMQTFTIYPYIENKPLEAAKVFSSLALFNILSLPLYIVTMIMNIVAHARVSTNRLLPFLLAPEVKGSDEQSNGTDLGAGPIEKVKERAFGSEML